MGFLETLRRVLTGEHPRPPAAAAELPSDPGATTGVQADETTPGPDVYDRLQWHKKLSRILEELPGSQPEWPDLMAEARALGFESEWVQTAQHEGFAMLVRRAVSDRHITEDEHRNLDLARDLIGLSELKAEEILHAIVAEAEAFFGKPVKE